DLLAGLVELLEREGLGRGRRLRRGRAAPRTAPGQEQDHSQRQRRHGTHGAVDHPSLMFAYESPAGAGLGYSAWRALGRFLGGSAGNTNSNVLPAPGVLRTRTSPPCPCAIARTRGSPRPVPRVLRACPSAGDPVQNRSKMRPISERGIPDPASSMTMRGRARRPPARTDSLIRSPAAVCWTAFSSSASPASPSRSRAA